jgi:hypothetical protein
MKFEIKLNKLGPSQSSYLSWILEEKQVLQLGKGIQFA